MSPSIYDTNARAIGLARLRHTFAALKRSTEVVFMPSSAQFTSTTRSNSTVTRDGECTSTAHLSGATIATLVGLGYAYKVPPTQLWLLPYLHGELPTQLTSPVVTSRHVLGYNDIETVLRGGAPNISIPTLPVHPSNTTSTSRALSTSSVNSASRPRSTACSSASESFSLSMVSTPYASSSSADSDSSFEVPSPPTATVGIPAPREPRIQSSASEQSQPPDSVAKPPKWPESDSECREIEAQVLQLMNRLNEEEARRTVQPQDPQLGAAPAPEPDDARSAVASELHPEDDATSGTDSDAEMGEEESKAGDYADGDFDDEQPTVISNPHSGNVYTLGRALGTGGFSSVMLATDSKGRRCAAKIVDKQKVFRQSDGRQNLLREKEIMAKVSQLETSRLVSLLECWESENEVYFIMVGASVVCTKAASHPSPQDLFPCTLHDILNPPEGVPEVVPTEDDERLLCAEMVCT